MSGSLIIRMTAARKAERMHELAEAREVTRKYPIISGRFASVEDLEIVALDDVTGAETLLSGVLSIVIEAKPGHAIVAKIEFIDPDLELEAYQQTEAAVG